MISVKKLMSTKLKSAMGLCLAIFGENAIAILTCFLSRHIRHGGRFVFVISGHFPLNSPIKPHNPTCILNKKKFLGENQKTSKSKSGLNL